VTLWSRVRRIVIGTSVAQAIMIVVVPFLTRIYSPSDFGVASTFTAALAVLSVISCLRFETAIPQAKSNVELVQLATIALVSLILVGCVVAISLVIIQLFTDNLPDFFGSLLVVGVLLSGVNQILTAISLKKDHLGLMARARIIQSASTASFQLTASTLGGMALIVGQLLGVVMSTGLMMGSMRVPWTKSSCHETLAVAKKYRDFPRYSAPDALVNSFGNNLPIFAFSFLFGAPSVGLFALVKRVLVIPLTVLGSALGQAFHVQGASVSRQDLRLLLVSTTKRLLLASFLACGFFAIFGPQLAVFFLGAQWADAGTVLLSLLPWLTMQFIASPVSVVFLITGKQSVLFRWQISLLFIRLLVISLGFLGLSFPLLLITYSMSSALMYLVQLALSFRAAGLEFVYVFGLATKYALIALITLSPLIFWSVA